MSDTYTCAKCGGTFKKAWSDEEANAEYDEKFAEEKTAGEERDVVCDGCYKILTGQ